VGVENRVHNKEEKLNNVILHNLTVCLCVQKINPVLQKIKLEQNKRMADKCLMWSGSEKVSR